MESLSSRMTVCPVAVPMDGTRLLPIWLVVSAVGCRYLVPRP